MTSGVLRELIKVEGVIEIDLEEDTKRIVWQKGEDIWILDEDGELYYRNKRTEYVRKVLFTEEQVRETLSNVHDNGHFCHKKCYARLQRTYFWWGMAKDSKTFCRSCPVCQCRIALRKNVGGQLGRILATRR